MEEPSQAVEHYEITRYRTLKRRATELGLTDAAGLLDETLKEESQTDIDLTELAERNANARSGEEGRLKAHPEPGPSRSRFIAVGCGAGLSGFPYGATDFDAGREQTARCEV